MHPSRTRTWRRMTWLFGQIEIPQLYHMWKRVRVEGSPGKPTNCCAVHRVLQLLCKYGHIDVCPSNWSETLLFAPIYKCFAVCCNPLLCHVINSTVIYHSSCCDPTRFNCPLTTTTTCRWICRTPSRNGIYMIEKLHTTTLPRPPPPQHFCVAAFVDKQVPIGMKVLPVIDWKIHCPSDLLKLIALHNNNNNMDKN